MMSATSLLGGIIVPFIMIQQVRSAVVSLGELEGKMMTATDVQVMVDGKLAQVLQQVFNTVDWAVEAVTTDSDNFSRQIRGSVEDALGRSGTCVEDIGRGVIKGLHEKMDDCPAAKALSQKRKEFEIKHRTLEREVQLESQDILAQALGICRSSGNSPCSSDPYAFIDSRFQPLYTSVREFSAYALPLFGDDFKRAKYECFDPTVLESLLVTAKVEIKQKCR